MTPRLVATRNDTPARPVPHLHQRRTDRAGEIRGADQDTACRTAARHSGDLVIGARDVGAREDSPTGTVPQLGQGLFECADVGGAHRHATVRSGAGHAIEAVLRAGIWTGDDRPGRSVPPFGEGLPVRTIGCRRVVANGHTAGRTGTGRSSEVTTDRRLGVRSIGTGRQSPRSGGRGCASGSGTPQHRNRDRRARCDGDRGDDEPSEPNSPAVDGAERHEPRQPVDRRLHCPHPPFIVASSAPPAPGLRHQPRQ
jgi:hypothetical protein